ncbi:lysophospholipid acyltransferase 1 isoform X1 [Latimeria chalumnae]|uniref:lysophospholipid acyltransferase 1 isoform X1 n=1 Tax=Latimeria chalumnae TaxID=7897 RepID=UPI00313CD7B2
MAEQPSIPYRTTGSTLLHPVSDLLGVPLDQVNFVACQLFALLAAFWFRIYLSPSNTSCTVRHAVVTLFGIYFVIFCFGWYSLHIFLLISVCYLIINNAKIPNIHSPLMIVTQKVTTLAFQLHDGIGQKAEEPTPEQRKLAVKARPSLLEYLSYHFNFMSILAGPCSNYKDYIDFIEGRHISTKLSEVNWKQKGYDKLPEPSPLGVVVYKMFLSLVSLVLFLLFSKTFPVLYSTDDRFINEAPFLARLSYVYIAIQACRPKYYFAWTLADAVNNAAGFGFNGVDEKGNFKWDLISNLNIWNIETATSFKMYIDNWNIQTAAWLKRVCYDRAPKYPTALTFILSAMWHGVYPGYYFTFLTAIPITLAARVMRKNFRKYFLSSRMLKAAYDVSTWFVTQLAICYTVAPFVMLAAEPTLKFYRSMYYYFHIISIVVLLMLPVKPQSPLQEHPSTQAVHNNHCSKKEK